jgi:glycerol-3-phosphate dehydrogenase
VSAFDPFDLTAARCRTIDAMQRDPIDVLVIGGGIVGAGVARDAAMRGLKTALVDRFDFAFGTSSRSSRLLHGGLRYLAQGRLKLVREASAEKIILRHIAPHLAAPLPFIFPSRRGTEWKKWKLAIGVKLYDWLCGGENLGPSSRLNVNQVLQALPQLNAENLTGAVRYFDAMTNDARLVLDSLRSAQAAGAALINYAPVERVHRDGESWRCELTDAPARTSFDVRARCVVNATGAWADKFPPSQVKLRLTKGVHLVVDRDRLNVPDAVVMSEGSRILFAIPWGQRVILGTTDTDYAGPTDSPTCDESDMRYILDIANSNFPSAKLTRQDIISTWAGLRPLIGQAEQSGKPSDISRAHQIRMTDPGWFDVAGGKLTTYRLMAEQTVDRVVDFAEIDARPCETATTPLLPPSSFSLHPSLSGILPPPVNPDAIAHFCHNEWAVHLTDVMIRRTSWRYYHRDHLAIARQIAPQMAQLLGWDAARTDEELADYQRQLDSICPRDGSHPDSPPQRAVPSGEDHASALDDDRRGLGSVRLGLDGDGAAGG